MPSTARKRSRWWSSLGGKGRFFAEALWTFYLPKFDVLRQLLEAKAIGEIKSVFTDYGEYFTRDHRIFDPKLAGGPLLDLGTYPGLISHRNFWRAEGCERRQPVRSQRRSWPVVRDPYRCGWRIREPFWTTLYGFTPTNAIVIGTEGAIQFDRNFHLPGPFTVSSADGSQTLRYEEPSGRHFEGLYYEAAEVARCITAGELETPYRTLEASLNTMATLDMIRRSVGIDFRQQAWWSTSRDDRIPDTDGGFVGGGDAAAGSRTICLRPNHIDDKIEKRPLISRLIMTASVATVSSTVEGTPAVGTPPLQEAI